MTFKDDIPGFHLNRVLHPNSENPLTLPTGFDYEIPLSLNAETCFSEFKNVEKVPTSTITPTDMSDLLYNAYSDA